MKIQLLANIQNKINVVGSFVRVLEAGDNVEVVATLLNGQTQRLNMQRGIGWDLGQVFESLEFTSSVNQSIEFVYTNGRIDDNRWSGVIDVRQKPMNGFKVSNLAVTSIEAVIAHVNLSRFGMRIKNTGASEVKIGGVDVVQNGYPLSSGEFIDFRSASASEVYAVATSVDSSISVFEETEYQSVIGLDGSELLTEQGAIIYAEDDQILKEG